MKNIQTLTVKDARESSIFAMLGLAYSWRSPRLASFYKVTQFQFEMWLYSMGMTDDGIRALSNPYIEEDVCFYCGCQLEDELTVMCSNKCHTDAQNKQETLNEICGTGLVPVLIKKDAFYNVSLQRVVQL